MRLALYALVALSCKSKTWQLEVIDLPLVTGRPSLAPDGRLAWAVDRKLFVADADGTNPRALPPTGAFGDPRWTRDGTHLLTANGSQLEKIPVNGGAPIKLGITGHSPDACGAGMIFLRRTSDGDRVLYLPPDGLERELVRGYADEKFEQPRCDPSGTRVLVLRDGDVISPTLTGTPPVILTTDHGTTAVHAGDTIVTSTTAGKLFELGGRELGEGSAPEVSRDGTTLVFQREVSELVINGRRMQPASNLRAVSNTTLLGERGGAIVAIDVAAGTERIVTPGRLPFPSLDGKLVYFRAEDPTKLMSIPLAGGSPKLVATLPGRIVLGVDGPDGQHVMVDEPEHHLVSNRVGPDGTLTDEGAHWVVPAPSGGWRFWQTPGLELRVIAPGKALGSMDCVFSVESKINQWLDDHRLAYLADQAWHVLDVRTCTDDKPQISTLPGDRDTVIAPDGMALATKLHRTVTHHRAINFATRPR